MFRDFAEVESFFGRGTYVAHATADDGVVHRAQLTIARGTDDVALYVPCLRLVIDGPVLAVHHLRRYDTPVDCMTCLVRGWRSRYTL